MRPSILTFAALLMIACSPQDSTPANDAAKAQKLTAGQEVATFAGGCFWCMVAPFVDLPGVASVTSGYSGGKVANPTYEQVSTGSTGHAEVVQIVFDPKQTSYEKLLAIFWRSIDPTDAAGQFCDIGTQYRTAVFYHGDAQKKAAEASREALAASGVLKAPIATEITAASPFYPAEEYHQDYFRKQEMRYQMYRASCGRDAKLKQLYGAEAEPAHP
jgi:peptide-methionine (S)-S-oxide reductase